MRTRFVFSVVLIALVAAGCGNSGSDETAPAATTAAPTTTATPATTAAPTTTVAPTTTTTSPTTTATPTTTEPAWTTDLNWDMCLVFGEGGRKDGGLNHEAWNATERFRITMAQSNDYGEATTHFTEVGDDGEAAEAIDRYAALGCDIVVTSGRDLAAATVDAARRHPALPLVGVDQRYDQIVNNLYGFYFPGETGGRLAGALAASITINSTVAILVDGEGGAAADDWRVGFEAGVAHVDAGVSVVVEDASGDGAAAARAALDRGADVVFAADPDTSAAALVEVASQPGSFCIGIGADQWKNVPEAHTCLVSSVVKAPMRMTVISKPVYGALMSRFVAASGGAVTIEPGNFALDVELAPFHDHEDAVTDDVREMLTALDDSLRPLSAATAASFTAAATTTTAAPATTTAAPATTTTTTEPPDPRFTFEQVEGVPGVDDEEIAFAVIGIRTLNPLGTCILDCYLDGIEAYFAFRNAEGGLFGRELSVGYVLDDELFSNQVRALEVISADDVFGVFNATLIANGWGDLNDSGIPTFTWNIHATESANRTNIFGHIAAMCATCTQRAVPYTVKIAGATKVASLGYGVSENSKVCTRAVADSIDLYSANIGAEMAYFNDSLGYGLPNGIAPEVTQMKELGVDFISTCMDLNAMKTMAQELSRQGMGDVVLYHPNTYNHPFVAEAGDLFDGDFVTPQFLPFEADADNAMQEAFIDTMTELGRDLSELAMIGWINADAAYTAVLSAGPVFDQKSAIDALNSQTDYDAGGLIVPIDWSRQHVPPVEGDAANDYALECFAPVRMSGGALETVADPATPWYCWDNTTLDWAEPTQTVFGG